MRLWERLLIRYSITPLLKTAAYLLALILIVSWLQSKASLLLLLVPLAADVCGGLRIRTNHPRLVETLCDALKEEVLRSCAIKADEPHYDIFEESGNIRHWLARDLPDSVALTTMAPKLDFLTIAKKTGLAFPPETFEPPAFRIEDDGTVEVYYSSINAIEIRDNLVVISTSGGAPIEYEDHTGAAFEAVSALRSRLREYKARLAPTTPVDPGQG